MSALPEFRKHGSDKKFSPLVEADCSHPPDHILSYIDFISELTAAPLDQLKILDLGCGRGEMVGALRARGIRAFGVEIDPRFVASGSILEEKYSDEFPILSTASESGKNIFPNGYFDVVISDQVLEHVADLRSVTDEITRVLRPNGLTCHHFPAKFRMVEPHYRMPFVHWLPKNRLRKSAILLLLAAGFSRPFFPSFSILDRGRIIYKYSVEETFYRSVSTIAAEFTRSGMRPIFREGMRAYVRSRLKRRIPDALPVAELVSTFRVVMFCAVKEG